MFACRLGTDLWDLSRIGFIIKEDSLRMIITEKKQVEEERKLYTNSLEEILVMTSHRVRKPLSTCLGLTQLIEDSKPLTQEELKKIVKYLKLNALELDTFTKELTTFIYRLKKKYEKKNRGHSIARN